MTNKITVYQLDRAGHFVEAVDAWESALEPGVFHIPAGAIRTPPPADVPEGMAPRWNGSAWEVINRPVPAAQPSPTEKLAAFLLANPDVAALVTPPTA